MNASAAAAVGPILIIGGRRVRVVKPTLKDVRLRLAAVIISLQVLGQTVLGFKVSVAQILVTLGVSALLETAVLVWRDGLLAWPASAMLTGNSVAFILRTTGTGHGDWWSLNGIQWFIVAAVLSLGSKYLIRVRGRHVFNPSNVGLVGVLLVGGVGTVFPQYLWWGSLGPAVGLALAVILVGALWVLRPVGMLGMALAFWTVLAALVGVLAAASRCMVAAWHPGAICGGSYWVDICTSPEVLVFVFFMMSDPMTAPRSRRARLVYGAATAVLAAALLSFQPAEFGVKLAILSSLTVTCAAVPVFNRLWPAASPLPAAPAASAAREATALPRRPKRLAIAALLAPAWLAVLIIAVAAPLDTSLLAGDPHITAVELGLGGVQ
ncbi:MAG: RnfABCDGE type electron transport complex subunit D [Candidatus Dormibacteria bacterium]